ncbi:uncharacterized protein LOC128223708 [Mya arenaria]|uniref:uncharacterized protein LOC128223708 n=1 Tax=Mya arenaria TaxID=6604 RepID=UPI0022E821D3|nr:uncharacterized protein LOC128223708 [Mya arenaria]
METVSSTQNTTDAHILLNKSLVAAVKQGQLQDVKLYISKGANVNYKDDMNMSVLEHALIHLKSPDQEDIFRELLEQGANFNNKTRCGQTDFMFLVYSGVVSYEFIATMLDQVDDIHERNLTTGGTFLHLVTKRQGDKYGRIVLMKKLLNMGLAVNSRDNNDDTPLHLIAGIACHDSLAFLFDNGSDPKTTNRHCETVLHYLSSSNEMDGFSDCLKLILHHGISINSVDKKRQTALHHALQAQETTRAGLDELIRHGIQTNMKDTLGRNEVYHAVNSIDHNYCDEQLDEREEIIKLLADFGVDVNEGDVNGVTPLHISVSTVYSSMLSVIGCLLYTVGANPEARTRSGATPLHWACRSFNQTFILVHWYEKHGLDVNVVDDFGSSALHWAVWFREISVARLLLQRGIDPSLKDKGGGTAADLAKKVHLDSFIELLGNYKSPQYNGLDENISDCSERDSMFACKQLRYIRKVDGKLADAEYIEHVELHKIELKSAVDTIVLSTNMGLYHEIEENVIVASLVKNLMRMVQQKISTSNPLFRCKIQLAGSNFEGTKVNLPDEFDYKWKFEEFGKAFEPMESDSFPGGFIKLRIKSFELMPKFARYVNTAGELDCKLLLTDFYTLVNKELDAVLSNNSDIFDHFICDKHLNEISYSIDNLSFTYYGRQAKCLPISVDVVPTIDLRDWKPDGFREKDRILLQTLGDTWECSVVFKTPDRLFVKDFTLYYRLSFAFLEQSILSRIPYCVRKGYIILKSLAESKYCPKCVDHDNQKRVTQYITSYQMKTAFLFELEAERLENKPEIDEEALSREESKIIAIQWAYRIIAHLEKRIQNQYMPSYFDPKRSIFGFAGWPDGMVDSLAHAQQAALMRQLLNIYKDEDSVIYERHVSEK